MKKRVLIFAMVVSLVPTLSFADSQIDLCKGQGRLAVPAELQGVYEFDNVRLAVNQDGIFKFTNVLPGGPAEIAMDRFGSSRGQFCARESLVKKGDGWMLKMTLVENSVSPLVFGHDSITFRARFKKDGSQPRVRVSNFDVGFLLWIIPSGKGTFGGYEPMAKLSDDPKFDILK